MKTYQQFVSEAAGIGLYSFRKPSLPSTEILSEWIAENRIPNPIPPGELHTTVIHSDVDVPGYVPDPKSVWINPATYCIDTLGDALVLRFKSEVLSRQWDQANRLGAKNHWPTFQPHLSLSYNVPEDFDYLEVKPLSVQLILDEEKTRPLVDGWASVNNLREYTIGDMTLGGGPGLQTAPPTVPQVQQTDIPEFVTWLERQGISVSYVKVTVANLRPVGTSNSGKPIPDAALVQPLVVSADNFILDGRARWQTLLNRDPHFKVDTYQVNLPIRELVAISHGFPKVSYR